MGASRRMSSPHAVRRWFQWLPDVPPTVRPDARAGIVEQHICRAPAQCPGGVAGPPVRRRPAGCATRGMAPVTASLLERRLERASGVTLHPELLPGNSARILAERFAPGFGIAPPPRAADGDP